MMKVWLKDGAKEQLAVLQKRGLFPKIEVSTDNTWKDFIYIYEDLFNPTINIPDVPKEMVEKFTFEERISSNLRAEGIYRHGGAEMLIKIVAEVHDDSSIYPGTDLKWEILQKISISAPSVASLKEIYTLMRQGKLSPVENWETNPVNTLPVSPQVEKTKAGTTDDYGRDDCSN